MRRLVERVTDIEFRRAKRTDLSTNAKDFAYDGKEEDRLNLFTSLVRAHDPQTGKLISRNAVISNAITFLTVGSHSTASNLEIFSWYLLHYPDVRVRRL
jgi:cytochrome P450